MKRRLSPLRGSFVLLLGVLVFLALGGSRAQALAAGQLPAWNVLVIQLVSETHVVPTTGVVIAPGKVLVPAAFVSTDNELVVLDGGTEIRRHGLPALVEQRMNLAGLAVLAVEGLSRPAVSRAAQSLSAGAQVALLAFPPASQLLAGETRFRRLARVRRLSSGLPGLSEATPLPNLTGPLVNACDFIVGQSVARGAEALTTSGNTLYLWGDDLFQALERAGYRLDAQPCDRVFESDSVATAAEIPPSPEAQAGISGRETPDPPIAAEPTPIADGAEPSPEVGKVEESPVLPEDGAVEPPEPNDSESPVTAPDPAAETAGDRRLSWVLGGLLLLMVTGLVFVARLRSTAYHAAPAPPVRYRLSAQDGDFLIRAPAGPMDLVLGRYDADVLLPHASVSRRHLRLREQDGKLSVTDLGSTNGTWVDDHICPPGEAVPVSIGAVLKLGDQAYRVLGDASPDERDE